MELKTAGFILRSFIFACMDFFAALCYDKANQPRKDVS